MRLLGLTVALVLLAAVLPASAAADADPASDILISSNVFLPYGMPADTSVEKELRALTDKAASLGFPLKVAVIRRPLDLGGIFSLFGRPQPYATFLGKELRSVGYRGNLLVAMQAGFGLFGPAATAAAKRALRTVSRPAKADPEQLSRAAALAARRFAGEAGHSLDSVPASSGSSGSSAITLTMIIAGSVAAAFAVAAFVVPWWRRRTAA